MRSRISVLLILIGLSIASRGQTVNPILPHADPFITYNPATSDGRYVLTATTGKNITLWSGRSPATSASDPHIVFSAIEGMTQLWSPTIWHIGNHWWIYFTAKMTGEPHALFALESNSSEVLGSYTFRGKLETGRPSIDPSLLELEGARYLMYVTVDRGENAIWIRRLKSAMEFEGEAALLAEPQYAWEKGEGSKSNYPVNEGPTALYHAGKTFIIYSASHTASPRYCMGLMTLVGSDVMVASSWKKTSTPVFEWSLENSIFGPGRGTFAQAKDGSNWLLYAAKTVDTFTAENRAIRVQPFTWDARGYPVFGIPAKDGVVPK